MSLDTWHQYLQSRSAHIKDGRITHFSTDALAEKRIALEHNTHCDISHYGLIRVNGEEAQSFLQNQFCNDVAKVTDTLSQLNGYCTPKGRALTVFRLFLRGNDYYLRLPQSLLEAVIKRLRMYLLRSKASLQDAGNELIRIGVAGPHIDQTLAALLDSAVPTETDASLQAGELTLIRCAGNLPRFEIYGPQDAIESLWQTLDEHSQAVGSDVWDWLELRAGIPEVLPETVEEFVPQMINLQAVNALSFKKGCYPGQEIVARMHYLGKLKRRMYLAHADSTEIPAPGSGVFSAEAEGGKGVGKVVRAQAHPDGGVDLLAVLEIASAEDRPVYLASPRGPLMNLQNLPYIVEESRTNQK